MTETHDKRTETHARDCISRQAAISEIGRWKGYLDDDMVLRMQTGLKRLTPVDAVTVVRCKDCVRKDRESGFCYGRGFPMQLVPDDGFCDKGKAGE